MSLEDRTDKGEKLLADMLGEERYADVRQHWKKICPDFEQYLTEFLGGEIWSRPGLDRRTKSLVSIATLASLGRTRALDLNLQFAKNNGVSKQDLVETFLQIAIYAGFPVAWEGLAKVADVYGDDDE